MNEGWPKSNGQPSFRFSGLLQRVRIIDLHVELRHVRIGLPMAFLDRASTSLSRSPDAPKPHPLTRADPPSDCKAPFRCSLSAPYARCLSTRPCARPPSLSTPGTPSRDIHAPSALRTLCRSRGCTVVRLRFGKGRWVRMTLRHSPEPRHRRSRRE